MGHAEREVGTVSTDTLPPTVPPSDPDHRADPVTPAPADAGSPANPPPDPQAPAKEPLASPAPLPASERPGVVVPLLSAGRVDTASSTMALPPGAINSTGAVRVAFGRPGAAPGGPRPMPEGPAPSAAAEPTGAAAGAGQPAPEPAPAAAPGGSGPRKPDGRAARGPDRHPVDREFLPAALEVLETPPSPVRLAVLIAICTLAAVALVWSWVGKVDVVAVAAGKIQPTGRVKVVQPLETGRILAVSARDGQEVREGEVLVRLDPREAQADVAGLEVALQSFEAEAQRRQAALEAVQNDRPPAEPQWGANIPAKMRQREARVLLGEVSRLNADAATLDAELLQAKAEEARLVATIEAQQLLLGTQDTRVDMRAELLKREVGSKAQLLDAQEVRQQQEVNLRVQKGQLAEVRASLSVNEKKRISLIDGYIADNMQRLADVERRIDDTRERLAKAIAVLDHLTITAPIAGTITALAVIGPGQVVTTGQEIMRIVPEGSKLELEVYMPNRDIGFIHIGQHAVVKLDSFPFTRYGTISGTVARVAEDAVAEPDLQQALASPASSPRTSGVGGTQRMQALVFPVTIALDEPFIRVDGLKLPLSPGMTAVAEVKTAQRRIIDYLFSPLVDVGSTAMRER